MLNSHVRQFEKIQGGRALGVRRFVNFLRGGVTLTKLEHLNVSRNRLTGPAPPTVAAIPTPQYVQGSVLSKPLNVDDAEDGDVLFQSEHITILRPDSLRGALVFTRLKTTAGEVGDSIDKSTYPTARRQNHVFFRAATLLGPLRTQPNRKSVASELLSFYNMYAVKFAGEDARFVVIRVDPHESNVFWSEDRQSMGMDAPVRMSYSQFLSNPPTGSLRGHPNLLNAELVFPDGYMPKEWFVAQYRDIRELV